MKYKFKRLFFIGVIVYSVLVSQIANASSLDLLPIEKCKVIGSNKLNSATRYEDSGHIEDWSNFLRPIGNIRSILIPLDTPDSRHVTSIEKIKIFAKELSSEYSRLSHNSLKLDIEVLDNWITLPRKGTDYENSLEWWVKVQDAIQASDPLIDFSKFDLVIFKHDEQSSTVTSAGALPMWTQTLPDGIKVLRGVYIGRDYWVSIGQGVSEAIHEIGHVFGLPDLYMQNSDGTVPVGIFDLMSSFNSKYQSQFLGWHKWKLGWIPDQSVVCASSGSSQIFDFVADRDKTRVVVIPITSSRLLSLELYFSNASDNNPSLIAYTVDTDKFVWTSNGTAGKVSPIQMLRPINAVAAPKNYGDLNLGARFFLNDSVKIDNATIKVVYMQNNVVSISYTPEGKQEVVSDRVKQEAEAKLAAELKAKQEAEAKAAADKAAAELKAKQEAEAKAKASATKKITITCVKGKLTRKVTAVNPKCPEGYKKK